MMALSVPTTETPPNGSTVAGEVPAWFANSRDRQPQLDVLRGAAIILVLLAHPPMKLDQHDIIVPAALFCQGIGWTGVDLFFVLSGFLVGGLLFKEIRRHSRLDVGRFLIRRGFKIWPSYFVYLAVVFLKALVLGIPLITFLPLLIHLQNYIPPDSVIAVHTWSLAVEEHFYLLLPLALLAFGKGLTWQRALTTYVAIAIFCMVLRWINNQPMPVGQTHLRIDGLGVGVLLAFGYVYHPSAFYQASRHRLWLVPLGISLVILATRDFLWAPRWQLTLGPMLLSVGYAALIVATVTTTPEYFSGRLARWFAVAGVYSYCTYLWHIDGPYVIMSTLARHPSLHGIPGWIQWPVGMILFIVLAVAVGRAASSMVELPLLAIRDRIAPSRTLESPSHRAVRLEPAPLVIEPAVRVDA